MTQASAKHTINADIETVWNIATDLVHLPEVISAITDVELITGGDQFEIGTRWRETRMIMRRSATEEMVVTAVDPHRRYVVQAENAGMHYLSTFTFAPAGPASTEVTMSFAGRAAGPQNILARMMGRLGMRIVRKSLEKDLEDLAIACEAAAMDINPT